LGVSPTHLPGLINAFLHLDRFRESNETFGIHARNFVNGILPPRKHEVKNKRAKAKEVANAAKAERTAIMVARTRAPGYIEQLSNSSPGGKARIGTPPDKKTVRFADSHLWTASNDDGQVKKA
jgi:hypothetical protein